MKISVFKNAKSVEPVNTDVSVILNHIKTGYWATKIEHLRSLDKASYDEQKKMLPAVTFTGTFTKRENAGIEKYSGIVCLDIDKLEEAQVKNLKKQFLDDKLIYTDFISPSGKGIKILIKVNTGPENHLSAFLHLQKVFEEKYYFKVDDSGKDLARLCFVSYDPDMIVDESSRIFEVDCRYGEVKKYTMPEGLKNVPAVQDAQKIFDLCVKWVSNTSSYVQGQRNRFVHSLACACNRVGMEMSVVEVYLKSNYDLDHKEIDHCVKSAYFKNQGEHGSVQVKDIGIKEFKAPAWVMNYTDDVVLNDIMQTTAMLHSYKIPHDKIYEVLKPIGFYYHMKGFIDLKRRSLGSIMNEAVNALNNKVSEESEKDSLQYTFAEDVAEDLLGIDFDGRAMQTTFPEFDAALSGGIMPGNFYGIIGTDKTYKSILAQFISFISAMSGKVVLYANGEMSKLQYYERLARITLNVDLKGLLESKKLTRETLPNFIKEMDAVLGHNLILVQGSGFNEKNILATIENIKSKHGKRVEMVIIDGIGQMDSNGLGEAQANIYNTAVAKEIAKKAHGEEGVAVLGLMHVSGENDKLFRDTGIRCRGGIKSTGNMDGYFSTSLLASESNNSLDKQGTDIDYVPDKFYLKFTDKRGSGGIVNGIINVHSDLRLTLETTNVNQYEIKIQGR